MKPNVSHANKLFKKLQKYIETFLLINQERKKILIGTDDVYSLLLRKIKCP